MRAQIMSIGSELMLGHLTDTNATFLAQQLAGLGIELTLVTQVGDDLPRLTEAIRRATAEAAIVICTGGVGPTADDLTREAIAEVAGEDPIVQEDLLAEVRAFFHARGIDMPERNKKQAWLIPSAEALRNPVGTAPGWFVRLDGHAIAAMPGVPREMFRMWREQVVPRLLDMGGQHAVRTVTLKTIGIGESAAEQVLADLVDIVNPVVATYAKDDGVHVRITAISQTAGDAERQRDEAANEVRRRLADFVYAEDDISLPQALASALERSRLRLSIDDMGGGGRFAALMTSDPSAARIVSRTSMAPSGEPIPTTIHPDADGTVHVAIVVNVAEAGDAVFEGTIDVTISGPLSRSDRLKIKSGWEDVQRRSALFAADVLRRSLLSAS